ncbi:glycosyltransferase family 2 protein [Butyrivibrio sp. XPD2002]|uniref:glycosyltransferase family 2 protein n=1 Tax=Butyrivibrio sp. XPD2002 TaxID=1280665 RepID=UPI0004282A48|nr:glycosyltransferase family 2 protein [Butyrivibrio sp. XPD2002]
MNDLVSVVIPIYNSEKNLEKCLDSILSQTYKNLEIILINDGSTDSSSDICKKYADKDTRIKYIEKKNEGQSITRNRGIDESSGRYLYFMDSDDYVDSCFIEKALAELISNKADSAIFNYYHIYDNGKPVKERDFLEGLYDLTTGNDRYNFFVKVFLPYRCGFEVWNRIYDANIIKNNNLRFPIFKPVVGEDLCFNFLYFLCTGKIYVSNDRYYYYVHNEGSTMDLNKGDIQLNRYNEISKIGYEFIEQRDSLDYLKKNYAYINILLAYHELMHYGLKESKEQLRCIKDKNHFKRMLRINPGSIRAIIKAIGIGRGIKYTLLGMFYKTAM